MRKAMNEKTYIEPSTEPKSVLRTILGGPRNGEEVLIPEDYTLWTDIMAATKYTLRWAGRVDKHGRGLRIGVLVHPSIKDDETLWKHFGDQAVKRWFDQEGVR